MLKKVISIGAKYIDGKWIKPAVTEASETVSKRASKYTTGKVYKMRTSPVTDVVEISSKDTNVYETSKVYTKMKTSPTSGKTSSVKSTVLNSVSGEISKSQVIDMLHLKTTPKGYVYEVSPSLEAQISNDLGDYLNVIRTLNRLRNPLSSKDIDNIQMLLNKTNGLINPNEIESYRIINLYKIIKGNLQKETETFLSSLAQDKAAIILNVAKGKSISGSQLEALTRYKNSGVINEIEGAISKFQKEEFDLISSYISTQKLPIKTVVHRIEGMMSNGKTACDFGCLDTVKLGGEYKGMTLSKVMEKINSLEDTATRQQEYTKLRKFIISTKDKYVAKNDRFMSTFFNNNVGNIENRLVWELHLPEKTQAVFMEGVVSNNAYASELELLLQKNSSLPINDILYDPTTRAWKVIADVF